MEGPSVREAIDGIRHLLGGEADLARMPLRAVASGYERFRDAVRQKPVVITRFEDPDTVVIDYDHYRRLLGLVENLAAAAGDGKRRQ